MFKGPTTVPLLFIYNKNLRNFDSYNRMIARIKILIAFFAAFSRRIANLYIFVLLFLCVPL